MIKTKANVSVEELGEQYCLIGPYNESCVQMEVEVLEPYSEVMQKTLRQMREHGLKVSHPVLLRQTFDAVKLRKT